MANIIILTDINNYSYHASVSGTIQATLIKYNHIVTILDINAYAYDHECLQQIKQHQTDILITLDLAGFRFRTQSGENALNMLFTKNLNLVWGDKPEYAPFLSKKLSLSMLFYDVSGINHYFPKKYANVLYYKATSQISTSDKASLHTETSFLQLWSDFTQEVLLSEK